MKVTQVSVFLDNKPGRLASMTRILGENHINIKALYVADTTDYGILRMIVDEPDRAKEVLKAAGFTAKRTQVMAVQLEDIPGGLHDVVTLLSNNDIDIEYLYAFTGRGEEEKASVVMKLSDVDKAEQLLG
ncbi:MAG: ACT domain-containing protein [Eubacteriales bacterium]|jgi:hypothetical protein